MLRLNVLSRFPNPFKHKTHDSDHLEHREIPFSAAPESNSEFTELFDEMAHRKGTNKRTSWGGSQGTMREQVSLESSETGRRRSGRRPTAVEVEGTAGVAAEGGVTKAMMGMRKGGSGSTTAGTKIPEESTIPREHQVKTQASMEMKKGESYPHGAPPAGDASVMTKEPQENRSPEKQRSVAESSLKDILTRNGAADQDSKQSLPRPQDTQRPPEQLHSELSEAQEEQATPGGSLQNELKQKSLDLDALRKEQYESKSTITSLQGQIEQKGLDLDALRKEQCESKSTITSLQSQLEQKSHEVDALRKEQRESKITTTALQTELRQKILDIDTLQKDQRESKSTIKTLQNQVGQLDRAMKDNDSLKSEVKRLKLHYENQNMELQQVKEKREADQVLLLQRTKELQEAQTYLTSTRTASGADIIRKVESLNAEILQAAASITDALSLDEAVSMTTNGGLNGIVDKELRLFIGEEIMAALAHHPGADDLDTIIQSGLQYLMVHHCHTLINSWSLEGSEYLAYIYGRIRSKERPSVAGRWRFMTKAQSKYAQYDMLENRTGEFMFDSIRLMIAEWIRDKEHEAHLIKIIEQKLRTVLNMAMAIDRIIGVDVVMEDWEVFYARPGMAFEQEIMDDVFRNPHDSGETEGLVLCPTGLGLRRTEDTPNGESEGWQVMLKGKTLLDSAFKK
ncbi:hypothetical protein E1B28_010426 [Marasmius oreades]|uniref:Uncharacterized protein n=1 Tax=Marasmius oreades TaxID=181124 RepID=A0A9P7RXR2_9AGAR|nr:uncharacterized protein E1B28_010426 [Marasmius oreades]KAG7091388.1 hypothetical protein E1B28_010426 [Marasmius oreades]